MAVTDTIFAQIARIRRNFARIRRHRNALLAKRKNIPLTIDTVALLHTIREEHDEYRWNMKKQREMSKKFKG